MRNEVIKVVYRATIMVLFLCLPQLAESAMKLVELPQANLKNLYTLDVYFDRNSVHALLSGVDQKTDRVVLRHLVSDDAGKNWSLPVTVNVGLASVKRSRRGNDFQVAAYGDYVIAAWQTNGSEPWVGIISLAESYDRGKTWRRLTSPVSQKLSMIDQGYFDLTADSKGNIHMVWLDDREENGNYQGLRYARYLATDKIPQWELHSDLDQSVCTCCWTDISTDDDGSVHVLFRDDEPRDMALISSTDRGKSWEKLNRISAFNWKFVGCPHQGGGMDTVKEKGQVKIHSVIWNGSQTNPGLFYSRFNEKGSKQWLPVISVGDKTSRSGDIAVLDSETIGLVYTVGKGDKKRIEAIQSADGGNSWTKPEALTKGSLNPSHPHILATSQGFRAFWSQLRENGNSVWMMTEF